MMTTTATMMIMIIEFIQRHGRRASLIARLDAAVPAHQPLCMSADRHLFPQEGIRISAERDCQVVPGNRGPLRFRMILDCHRALTGMPSFVVAMEEGRYGL